MIELRRNNVVKIVDSEERAKRLESEGYRRAGHEEDPPKPQNRADEFAAAVADEVQRRVAQLPGQADFEAAVATEVERRLAEMQSAAQDEVKTLQPIAGESSPKMGVAPPTEEKAAKQEKKK